MRVLATGYAILVLGLLLIASPVGAEALVPREHHEWGRFRPGAWKHVRLVREDLDENGRVVSTNTTDTTTTLISVDDDSATLRVDTIVEVAGRQFAKQPQIVTQGFGGEVKGQPVSVKSLGKDRITIDGRQLQSEVRAATVKGDSCQWTTRIHYCRDVAPYVMRREINSTDVEKDETKYETEVEVIAIDMPWRVMGEVKSTSHIRTTHITPKGKTITLEVRSEDVPGGYVAHTSKELDKEGRVIGRSTLELIDYYVPARDGPARVQYRRVWPRWYHRHWGN